MNTEEAFERDILDHPFDDTRCLIYADWLEERGDERGEFLRLQHKLSRMAVGDEGYREGCAREKKLLKTLDKVWVHRLRRYTTAPPCRDVAKLVPELAAFARTTIRLHPRPTVGKKGEGESKIGGIFLWPKGEEWPECKQHGIPLVPAVQLRKCDVPDVEFFGDSDLFQLLWCPFEREHGYRLLFTVAWRKAAEVTDSIGKEPPLEAFGLNRDDWHIKDLLPLQCSIYPERVLEYPNSDELYQLVREEKYKAITKQIREMNLGPADDLKGRFSGENCLRDAEDLYRSELSTSPGAKVGGKPSGKEKGKRFDHFLTLSGGEFSSAGFRRWVPLEDQRRLARSGRPLTLSELKQRDRLHDPLSAPMGMRFGRDQHLYLYVCRKGKNWPIRVGVSD